MIKFILRSLLGAGDGAFESYYRHLLETNQAKGAPTAAEAKVDYVRALRRRETTF